MATKSKKAAKTSAASPYKGVKSIGAGLKIGANSNVSRKEATKISKATGKSFDAVLSKALSKGFSIGGGAVKASNKAYGSSRAGIWNSVLNDTFGAGATRKLGRDPLAGMRGLELGKKQVYGGEYKLNGAYTPLVSPKISSVNPLGSSLNSMSPYSGIPIPTGEGPLAPAQDIPLEDIPLEEIPMEEPLMEDQTGMGFGSDVASFASGYRSKKSRRGRAGVGSQGFSSMRIAPSASSGIGVNTGYR